MDLKSGHCSPSREGYTHPTSGRSPDSRFLGLAAFPTSSVSGIVSSPPRLQWRGRAGFSPASQLSSQKQRQKLRADATAVKRRSQGTLNLSICMPGGPEGGLVAPSLI